MLIRRGKSKRTTGSIALSSHCQIADRHAQAGNERWQSPCRAWSVGILVLTQAGSGGDRVGQASPGPSSPRARRVILVVSASQICVGGRTCEVTAAMMVLLSAAARRINRSRAPWRQTPRLFRQWELQADKGAEVVTLQFIKDRARSSRSSDYQCAIQTERRASGDSIRVSDTASTVPTSSMGKVDLRTENPLPDARMSSGRMEAGRRKALTRRCTGPRRRKVTA